MKKINSFILALTFIVSACTSTPQVTIIPEPTATLPPPTETPIPTPTLHPQFAALQEQIAASGGRFTLNPDGTIFDGAEPLPGVTVAPDGTMTLTVDGETVTLDPALAVFDDENGFSYPGYEQNADGNWVEAAPSAEQVWQEEAKEWKIDPESVTVKNDAEGRTVVVENETKEVIYIVNKGIGYWNTDVLDKLIYGSGTCIQSGWTETEGISDPEGFFKSYRKSLSNRLKDELGKLTYPLGVLSYFNIGDECWVVTPFVKEDLIKDGSHTTYEMWETPDKKIMYKLIFFPDTVKLELVD